ncbi:MAG: CBO0543 family protein [Sporomusaceae bacterium]|nr:CBO0543 family protein [Sporomusaceae bacterium]
MSTEKLILYGVWIATVVSLFFLIPREKVRLALVAFLFKQFITWPVGLYVVDRGWIMYPVRFFENANQTSFTFEYFFFPVLCAYFNVYFPEGSKALVRAAYYMLFCSALTVAEVMLERYTDLIIYISWDWYLTWFSMFVLFYITRKFCLWFFEKYGGV